MKNKWVLSVLLIAVFFSCKSNKEASNSDAFFPVLAYIKSQVAHVDTSLYQITRLTPKDSISWDTAYIKREDFRNYAKDFLELPDLTEKKYAGDYKESKFFDASINQAVFTYIPKDRNGEIQRQEVTIEPGMGGKDKVKNFFIDKISSTKDSTIIKRMLWQVDESFQINTIIQKPDGTEYSIIEKIRWE